MRVPPRIRLRRLRCEEAGFTVVEGLVAGLILVIGALGALQVFDAGARNTYRTEESQVLNDRLQAELEAIRQLPYGQIAMTSAPVHQNNNNDPRWRVQGTLFATERNGSSLKSMVYNGGSIPGGGTVSGGTVNPGPTPFTAGDVSGDIYRFVTWINDPNCTACGSRFEKRVIVAATIDQAPAASYERSFQELHTDVIDPDAAPDPGEPIEEDPEETAKAQFWLTDTPCSSNTRQPITADHVAHNTRGVCSQGLTTGSNRGAPDLMYTEAAFASSPDPGAPFDYATDSEPAANPTQDKGILMPWASNDSCALHPELNTLDVRRLLEGSLSILNLQALPAQLDGILGGDADLLGGSSDKHQRIHTWVSPPIQGSGGALLGKGTLELYSQTINGAVHPGSICVWMSVRQSVDIPAQVCDIVCVPLGSTTIEVDLPYINVGVLSNGDCRSGTGLNLTNFQYSQNPWPSQWAPIRIPLCFAAVNAAGAVVTPCPAGADPAEDSCAVLPPNSRIAVSLMVRKNGTDPGQGLEFMYDAVGYESRLELETNKILSFGP
jgi:type II secretory pathway pseudopilin PulG